jgi:hypothetical protein
MCPRHREYRGGGGGVETKRVIRQIEVKKAVSFIAVEPLNVYQSKHTYILLAVFIFPKCSRG